MKATRLLELQHSEAKRLFRDVVFSLRQAMLAMDDAFPEPSEDDMVKAASSASSGPTRASFRIR